MNAKSRRTIPVPHGRMPTWFLVAAVTAAGGAAWLLPLAI